MRWWTKISTSLLAALVLASGGVFLALLWTGVGVVTGDVEMLELSATLASTEVGRVIATAITGVVMLVAISAVVAVWSAGRDLISVRRGDGEPVFVPSETMAQHVAEAARTAEHVERARASVTPDGDGSVGIALALRIDEEAEAGAVVSAVERQVASALEARYGIRMSRKPNMEVRHVARRHRRGRGTSTASSTTGGTSVRSGTAESSDTP